MLRNNTRLPFYVDPNVGCEVNKITTGLSVTLNRHFPMRSLLLKRQIIWLHIGKCIFIYVKKKYGLYCPDLHKTRASSTELCAVLSYRISPKSDKTCGKYGYKFTYALKHSTGCTVPNFTNITMFL